MLMQVDRIIPEAFIMRIWSRIENIMHLWVRCSQQPAISCGTPFQLALGKQTSATNSLAVAEDLFVWALSLQHIVTICLNCACPNFLTCLLIGCVDSKIRKFYLWSKWIGNIKHSMVSWTQIDGCCGLILCDILEVRMIEKGQAEEDRYSW